MATYEAGSAGPAEAEELIGEGRRWRGAVSEEQEPWDDAWWEQDTTPSKIEAALRELLATRHHESHAFVPARVLNLVVIADREYRGEIENRLQRVGRYHPSRLVLCSVSEGRDTIDARVEIRTSQSAGPGHIAVGRERIGLHIGPQHLDKLDTIVDPLLVPDLATVVWAPHGHAEGLDALRRLAQIVLLDSQDEPTVNAGFDRSADLSRNAYVVDLAWLRSTPWRERVAAAFDPPAERARLGCDRLRHRPPPRRLAGRRGAVLRLAELAAGLEARSSLGRCRRRLTGPRAGQARRRSRSRSSRPTRTRPGWPA